MHRGQTIKLTTKPYPEIGRSAREQFDKRAIMPKVFISYSSSDLPFVECELVPTLRDNGVDIWYSQSDVKTGEEWHQKIVSQLRECDWFLVVLSPSAEMSDWVRSEVFWAMKYRKGRVVPVLWQNCDVVNVHLILSQIQSIDLRNSDPTEWTRLVSIWKQTTPRENVLMAEKDERKISVEVVTHVLSRLAENPQLIGSLLDQLGAMPTLPTKTMGGKVFWDDLVDVKGWRLQRNSVFGNCRILDPQNVRRAWGGQNAMMRAFDSLAQELEAE